MGIIVQWFRASVCAAGNASSNLVDPPWRVGGTVTRLVEAEEKPVQFWYSPFLPENNF